MAIGAGTGRRSAKRAAAIGLVAALCGCAAPPPVGRQAIPKIPAGLARAWFYREDLPYDSFARPYVRMNGAVVGIAELGGAFYRDVAPGPYDVTADSYRVLVNQFPHVDLKPGETAYFQVFAAAPFASSVGASNRWARPTFTIWSMPAPLAEPAVARSAFYPGGG